MHKFPPVRVIPKNAVKVSDKKSDAIAYLFTQRDRPCAKVFFGKQSKPIAYTLFKTEIAREKAIKKWFEGRQACAKGKAEETAKRLQPNKLVAGDILNTCWGYDQTNREFYEVTEVLGQYVMIREIGAASTETGFMCGQCAPQSGKFIGEPMRKLVQYGNTVSIKSFITASKWNTSEVAGVKVGPALYWSSYA